ncbi:MAG: Ca2+-dependent phosphoinositide-specific phospholipase C [Pseudomonadales bacterium]|jgi:hypothetical protein|nr:Ca2+-dependent phosphoinositide-specific phospholipase C [Pseudomonadales bacterium]
MRVAALLMTALVLAGCAGVPADAPLRLNDIQALASHNSYKMPIDAALMERLLDEAGPRMLALDYAHPTLTEQLDLGLLKLELDVFHDPEGGRYAAPAGLAMVRALGAPAVPFDADAMRTPGFKVLHVQDLDFRSRCPTLAACLAELRAWSEAHPGHLPIAVSINAKQSPLSGFEGVVPLAFDAAAWDALDAALVAGLGRERLLTPDDVRGAAQSLRRAVLRSGWPTLDAVRGRFLFVLDERMEVLEGYLDGHPSLAGRAMFAIVPEDHPAAAFLILNDPIAQAERIRAAVEAGFLVRTRADADTLEARSGDVTRREAAFASGAQYVSTDYYRPDPRFRTGYQVVLPGGGPLRCNPVRRPEPECAPPPRTRP